jgi:hypothetical protein
MLLALLFKMEERDKGEEGAARRRRGEGDGRGEGEGRGEGKGEEGVTRKERGGRGKRRGEKTCRSSNSFKFFLS